jgi:hypothetical protein
MIRGGVVDILTAGSRVQLSNSANRVKWIKAKANPGNTGNIFFGGSDVSATLGIILAPADTVGVEIDLRPGSMPLSDFYADTATNGNDITWLALLE